MQIRQDPPKAIPLEWILSTDGHKNGLNASRHLSLNLLDLELKGAVKLAVQIEIDFVLSLRPQVVITQLEV